MCSQFEIKIPIKQLMDTTQLLFEEYSDNLTWDTHVYPFSLAPVIAHKPINYLEVMKYSLTPSWSKVAKPKFATYNARLDRPNKTGNQLELIYNMPTWRTPFRSQHCIVPITSFFESCREGIHAGNIVKFSKDNSILLTAGVWDMWVDTITGEAIHSFAIITDDPCDFIKEVGHDRQPVFLNLENAKIWLDNSFTSVDTAYNFLKHSQQQIDYTVENVRQLKGFEHDLFS